MWERGRGRLVAVAVVVALLAGAAGIGVLIVVRVSNHPAPHPAALAPAPPTAKPTEHAPTPEPTATSATPLAQALQVAATTPVILFADPADRHQIDGITWDGQVTGRVARASQDYILPNPTGTLYVDGTDLRARSGQVIGQYATPTKGPAPTWADDSRHYCEMVNSGGNQLPAGGAPTTLQLAVPGQSPMRVVQVGTVFEQTSVRVAACSIDRDLAVVVQSAGQGIGTAEYWVVQLSTGRVMWTHSFTGGASITDVVAARDAQYLAEVSYGDGLPTTTTVYSASGTSVAHLSVRIVAFSWDGSLAVSEQGFNSRPGVISWRDGITVWKGPNGLGTWHAFPEPNGQRIGVVVTPNVRPPGTTWPVADLYVVSPDGQAARLVRGSPSIG